MNIFQIFGFLFRFGPLLAAWGPLVLKLVRTVETLFSDAPTAQKKEIAMRLARAALERAGLHNQHLLEAFGHFIDLLVALLHARGEFTPGPEHRHPLDVDEAAVVVALQAEPKLLPEVQRLRDEEQATRDMRLDELEQQLRRD